MNPFAWAAAPTAEAAIAHVAEHPGAEFIAGGTDMLQLLQERVRRPAELIDINALGLDDLESDAERTRVGALVRMADLADDPRVRERFPVVVEALLASASPQVRNAASIGGNLLQRTRCLYFRDVTTPCNRRDPGTGCSALDGLNRINAVFGTSPHCIAAYPGDLAVALVAIDAEIEIAGPAGQRTIPVGELHRLPGDRPEIETVLEPGELITAVLLPTSEYAGRSHYLKVRDRATFEWAVASAAVALETAGDTIRQARVAVGGVATTPWRLPQVEQALVGQRVHADVVRRAARLAGDGASPRTGNAFKVELTRRVVERALLEVGGIA